MIKLNEDNQILLEYQQHATIKNKKYNYKELTIPSDIYNLWVQFNNNQPVQEAALTTITEETSVTTYITPIIAAATNHPLISDENTTVKLKIRINKSKPNKSGKHKQKATMTITKQVTLLTDDVTFILDPYNLNFGTKYSGLCTVEGMIINNNKEKKVSKEKKEKEQEIT